MRTRVLEEMERLSVICNMEGCNKVNTTSISAFDIEIFRDFISEAEEGANYHDIVYSLDSPHGDKDAYLAVEKLTKTFLSRRWKEKWEEMMNEFERREGIDFFMLMSYCFMISVGNDRLYDTITNIAWVLSNYKKV